MKDMNSKWLASPNDLSISSSKLSAERNDGRPVISGERRCEEERERETERKGKKIGGELRNTHVTPTRT